MRTICFLAALFAATSAQGQALSESFDGVVAPDLPSGWEGDWVTSGSSASSGSGGNNLVDTGSGAAAATSAPFSLADAGAATLTYLARRTSSYPAEAVTVVFVTAGGDFSAGVGLPAAPSAWTPMSIQVPVAVLDASDVRVRFESTGGTSSGSNARIDDVVVTVDAPAATGGVFGFSAENMDVLAGSSGVLVPLALAWNEPVALQGFQFTLESGSALLAGFQRGQALLDLGAWTVSSEGNQTLVIANGEEGLAAGVYDPVVSAVVDFAEVSDTTFVTFSLEGVVGAMAVPDGTDAGLVVSPDSAVVRVLPRVGIFQVADSLDLGEVQVGSSTSSDLYLFNRGTAELSITAIATGHPSFSVSPTFATISPGDSTLVSVSVTPTAPDVGYLASTLLFDGVAGTVVSATVGVPWGDATEDGAVDVGDIVLGVDVVLGRQSPPTTASLDLYPFPAGDGDIDVRDLTVLTHAVLRGEWPNAIPLPGPGLPAAKAGEAAGRFSMEGNTIVLHLDEPVRGVQADFLVAGQAVRLGPALVSQDGDRMRVLWVNLDGRELSAGRYPVASSPEAALVGSVAIRAPGERVSIPAQDLPATRVEAPYPNPFRPGSSGRLVLPGRDEARIYDALGREIWKGVGSWDGRGRSGAVVAAGLYAVATGARLHPVVVIR